MITTEPCTRDSGFSGLDASVPWLGLGLGLANPNPNPNPNTGEVLQWAAEKFEARADDKWRSPQWRTAGNALTAALRPGFLLQSPAHLTPLTESGEQAA